MADRLECLNRLINLSVPLDKAIADLALFEWDSEQALVQLKAFELREILTRYLNQEFTSEQIEKWANAIERRDDIDYSDVSEVLNVLANPLITTQLTPNTAQQLIREYL